MMEQAIERIRAHFPLTRRDAGRYARIKAGPMGVRIDWYKAAGLGNVSVIHGAAMGGLMQMDTLVINATERDVPLFSFDYIRAMGNHTMLVEYYDTLLDAAGFDASTLLAAKASVATLPDHDLGEHWYDFMKLAGSFAKRTKKAELQRLNAAFSCALAAYLALASAAPALAEPDGKREKAAAYVNGLLEKGGPSTDAFRKSIGEAETRALFTRIVFGTEEA